MLLGTKIHNAKNKDTFTFAITELHSIVELQEALDSIKATVDIFTMPSDELAKLTVVLEVTKK